MRHGGAGFGLRDWILAEVLAEVLVEVLAEVLDFLGLFRFFCCNPPELWYITPVQCIRG